MGSGYEFVVFEVGIGIVSNGFSFLEGWFGIEGLGLYYGVFGVRIVVEGRRSRSVFFVGK